MHIVFLDFDDIKNPLLGAGQAKATLEVGKRLAAKGHNISVISSRYPKSKDRLENGINYRHIGFGTKNIKLNNLVYILLLPFYVRKIKADIIIECFTAPISTLFSPLFTKVPVVALPTSFEADVQSQHYHLPFYLIERFGLKFYKYFLPYTKFDDEKMKKHNPKIISKIVPEGVGEEFFQIQRTTPKHILFIGRFDICQKGIDLLLSSYAKIKDQIGYPLVIAGRGPDENRIKDMITKLKLGDKVSLIGPAFDEKKAKLLSEAVFVAFPSRKEGFSLFSLEVLASGIPLLGFNIDALKFIPSDICEKAKPFNIDDYASLMLKFVRNNNQKEIAEKERNLVSKYTWERVANDFLEFFKEILSRDNKRI